MRENKNCFYDCAVRSRENERGGVRLIMSVRNARARFIIINIRHTRFSISFSEPRVVITTTTTVGLCVSVYYTVYITEKNG